MVAIVIAFPGLVTGNLDEEQGRSVQDRDHRSRLRTTSRRPRRRTPPDFGAEPARSKAERRLRRNRTTGATGEGDDSEKLFKESKKSGRNSRALATAGFRCGRAVCVRRLALLASAELRVEHVVVVGRLGDAEPQELLVAEFLPLRIDPLPVLALAPAARRTARRPPSRRPPSPASGNGRSLVPLADQPAQRVRDSAHRTSPASRRRLRRRPRCSAAW